MFQIPAYARELSLLRSFGGAHLDRRTWMAGNDTPCNKQAT